MRKMQKVQLDPTLIFSVVLFIVCMTLDFGSTEYFSQGDSGLEGNTLNALWWKFFGPFRHIDIPIWIGYIFLTTFFFMKWKVTTSRIFIPLWWLNAIAISHFFGFLSWLPSNPIGFMYRINIYNFDMTIVLSLVGILFGLFLARIQLRFVKYPTLYKL